MSGTTDKIKGAANEAIGNVKQTLGRAIGSDRLQAQGLVQKAEGVAQKAAGHIKDNAKNSVNKAADSIDKLI
jgi:uncharacterized protein YjbJ (UPF0337 family)